MSNTLKIWDPDGYVCSFTGIPLEGGRADGPFCEIEKADDVFKTKVGVDGQVTRSKIINNLHKVTLSFMQTAGANVILSGIHILDYGAPNGAGVGVLALRDTRGTSVFLAPEAWIVKMPDETFDAEPTIRKWVFAAIVPIPAHVVGGN